ncbi:MAG TPA: hypothetical protein VK580_13135 [Steroidobacteraceae bacterium]|jgi:hypothetical protein|nr:hypothetical protein [Steroidobacteraceae bacterium]
MSEVDRLSNSGLFPALPIADRRSSKDDKERGQRPDQGPEKPASKSADTPEPSGGPRPPKSHIDEYA